MRTLKKSLSLVLVLAMVCSFFVMGTSAAFEDAADIDAKYAEAIEVMNSLEILQGSDGKFDPQGTLNRAQAARIIVAMLGADELAKTATCTFTDVPAGQWYTPWIAYCQSIGLMLGYGDGTVGPLDELTGPQFALMLMKALKIDTSSVNPSTFELDTISLAAKNGLASVEELTTAPFTREIASGVAFRGLKFGETVVEEHVRYVVTGLNTTFVDDTTSANGKTYDSYSDALKAGQKNNTYLFDTDFAITAVSETVETTKDSLYATVFGGTVTAGVLTETAATKKAHVANALIEKPETVLVGGASYIASEGLDLLGHKVNVYHYPTLKGNAAYTIVDKATKVEEVTGVFADAAALNKALVKLGFKDSTLAGADIYNGYTISGTIPYGYDPMSLIVISNSATKSVDSVIVLSRDVARIDNITSKVIDEKTVYTYILDDASTFKSNEIFTADTLAIGDVVYVAASGDFKAVEKAETFEAVYAGSTTVPTALGPNTLYTFGEETYDDAVSVTAANNYIAAGSLVVGKTYTLVLDDYGRIAAIKGEAAVPQYAYLAAFGKKENTDILGQTATSDLTAHLYFADGTNAVVTINTNDDLNTAMGASFGDAVYSTESATGTTIMNAGKVYSYSVLNGQYFLTALAPDISGSPVAIGSNVVGTISGPKTVYGTDDSLTFFVNGTYDADPYDNTLTVQPIKGMAALAGKTVTQGLSDSTTGTALYVVGVVSAAFYDVAPTVYFYAGEYTSVSNATTETVTYTVYLNGEATTLTFSELITKGGVNENAVSDGMVKVNSTNSNIMADDSGYTFADVNVLDYYNGTLTVAGPVSAVVDMSKVYDMTYYSEFNGFTNLDKTTIVVYGQYKAVPNSANVIEQLYVVAVDSNDAALVDGAYTVAEGKTLTVTTGSIAFNNTGATAANIAKIVAPEGASVYYSATSGLTVTTLAAAVNAEPATAWNVASAANAAQAIADGGFIYVVAEDGQTITCYTFDDTTD